MKPLALTSVLLAAALLTACSDGAEPSTPVATSLPSVDVPLPLTGRPSASPSPSAAVARPSSGPAFPADIGSDTQMPTGAPLTVTAVRAARQAGYDRVVFELKGKAAGAPGWRVEYVDAPSADGSGDRVDVAGKAFLQVVVTGVGYPFDTGQTEASQDLVPKDTALVREVDLQATFEGQFTAFVGLTRKAPFRVFRLASPARVVVDVRTS